MDKNPNPNAAYNYYLSGYHAMERGEFRDAIKQFETAIHLNPEYYFAHLFKGKCFLELKEHSLAADCFQRAAALESSRIEPVWFLAITYSRMRDFRNAAEHYKAAIRMDADLGDLYHGLGTAYYFLEEYRDALKSFAATKNCTRCTIQPETTDYLRARCFEKLGEHAASLSVLDAMLPTSDFETTMFKVLARRDKICASMDSRRKLPPNCTVNLEKRRISLCFQVK